MGCVQTKGASCSSPRAAVTLERLKQDGGYVKVERAAEERRISRESERRHGGVSQRISAKKIVAVDETTATVDGWPRWLIENVKEDALAGFIPKSADSYDKLAKVGQGTYSNVYKARDKVTGKIVALKKVRFDTSEPESVKFMAREIIILKKLDHPNIIKLQGIATSRMQYSLYLVFDFMPSDLTKLISRTLTQPQAKTYMLQLLLGLQHCHDKGILHRDIKGSNLLIDKNGVLKIADFGLANFYTTNPLTSRVVTLWYRAPELLLGATDYGVGIDLWSAGCLLAEMFVGRPIMPGRNEIEQLHKIFKLCGSPSEDYWKTVRPPASFRPPQQYKANFEEAFPRFPKSALGLLSTLLSLDPTVRGTAATALTNEFFVASPLPCDPSGLPVISTAENGAVQSTNRRRISNAKQQSRISNGDHGRKVSFSDFLGEDAYAKQEMDMATSSSSSSSATKLSRLHSPPPSPTPAAFRTLHNRAAKTEAHPNALKNIKNYPLLLASLTEAANHLKESNSSLYRRSISHIDFRDLDLEKISKLFGLDDDNDNVN
ncbi:probable serine/threonine-protein kinase At1g54610 [Salvia miltiorrhiza]|uniref:probable serine/threonine-protein kinase At1g54610 n=1 Tax=Salvia miltiorrhiza TaxID=226208 RepID=UPI0025AC7C44|nr:probable serine/threonine-protein kinase At1g54610 [Salvia miltiorrhiza]